MFRMVVYRNVLDRTEHVVLTKGKIDPDVPTLVRVHKADLAADMLGHVESRQDLIPRALKAIAEHDGAGVAVFIRSSNPAAISERFGQSEADAPEELREFGIGAQILLDLGVRDMILLGSASAPQRLPGAGGYGLRIVERRTL
jgi:3,4-dihydroxy 2-butanone 4-phosphate synthase/GTP cyclohydrolase II